METIPHESKAKTPTYSTQSNTNGEIWQNCESMLLIHGNLLVQTGGKHLILVVAIVILLLLKWAAVKAGSKLIHIGQLLNVKHLTGHTSFNSQWSSRLVILTFILKLRKKV